MMNEIVKQEYVSPEIVMTVVEADVITFSEQDNVSWEGPIVS